MNYFRNSGNPRILKTFEGYKGDAGDESEEGEDGDKRDEGDESDEVEDHQTPPDMLLKSPTRHH